MSFFLAVWRILLELAPWLLVGTAVAGLLHVLLPRRMVREQLTGAWGVVKAVLVGVPMPLCSCGVIPAGLGLKKDGASDGAAVAFLISTPQTGVDSILVSASFLGWPFALFKVAAAAVTGVAGGWLTEAAGRSDAGTLDASACENESGGRGVRAAVDHGLSLLRSIWGWLVVGVLVSAAIDVWVPDAWLQGLGALGILGAAVAALVVSLPLYVCATASVPIAAALVAGGMPTGAALVFLMAGPATNVATIGAVYRGFGRRVTLLYLATITAGSIGAALLFDRLLEGSAGVAARQHAHAAWWAVAAAVVLLALLVRFAWEEAARRMRRPAPVAETSVSVAVEGMHCGGCTATLQSALSRLEGATSAQVTLNPGRAEVHGAVSEARVRDAVREAGYTPV
ncbi:MAG: permease [Thermoanaerobaculia bacterium]